MKSKVTKGTGIGGLLNYLTTGKNASAELIGGNTLATTPHDLVAEFSDAQASRPGRKRNVLHTSLRPTKGEVIDREKWVQIAERHLDNLGIDRAKHPYCIYLHKDHIHIAASMVGYDGSVWSDSKDVYKAIRSTWKIEKEFNLAITKTLMPNNDLKWTNVKVKENEKRLLASLGIEKAPKIIASDIIERAVIRCNGSMSDFIINCEKEGLHPIQSGGGVSFQLDGVHEKLVNTWKGSGIHKRYSYKGIQILLSEREKEYQNELGTNIRGIVDKTKLDRRPYDDIVSKTGRLFDRVGILSVKNDAARSEYKDCIRECKNASRQGLGEIAGPSLDDRDFSDRHQPKLQSIVRSFENSLRDRGLTYEHIRGRIAEIFARTTSKSGQGNRDFGRLGADDRKIGERIRGIQGTFRGISDTIRDGCASVSQLGYIADDQDKGGEIDVVSHNEQRRETLRQVFGVLRERSLAKISGVAEVKRLVDKGNLIEALEYSLAQGLAAPGMEEALIALRADKAKGGRENSFTNQCVTGAVVNPLVDPHKEQIRTINKQKAAILSASKGKNSGIGL